MKKTVLFLDVDGVFSIPNTVNKDERLTRLSLWDGHHMVCWPIPMYRELLYAIGIEKRLHPVWLSAWGDAVHTLTNHAMTQAFPVAYPLSDRQMYYARQRFSGDISCIDRKLIAAVYYLAKRRSYERVIWIEDGFAEETVDWAQKSKVKLIDTTDDRIRSMLLAMHEMAVQDVMELLGIGE